MGSWTRHDHVHFRIIYELLLDAIRQRENLLRLEINGSDYMYIADFARRYSGDTITSKLSTVLVPFMSFTSSRTLSSASWLGTSPVRNT